MLLAAALGAATASPQPPGEEPFSEVVEVRVVNVEVFATDRRGRPLLDLTKGDFRLLVDGEEVPLSHFRPAAAEPSQQLDDEGAGASGAPGAESPGGAVPRPPLGVVVYVDDPSLVAARLEPVIRELSALVEEAGERDLRFAVAHWDGRLAWRTEGDAGPAEVRAALEALAHGSAPGIGRLADFRRTLSAIDSALTGFDGTGCDPCMCAWDTVTGLWEAHARRVADDVARTADGLRQLVSVLGRLPGRKAVVYLSSGLEQRPGVALAAYLADRCPTPDNILEYQANRQIRYDESERLASLTALANSARVTLYPLQVRSSDAPSGLTGFARVEAEGNRRDGLRFLAAETGGEESLSARELFRRLESDFDTAYSLGFSPGPPTQDRIHEIRVELTPKRRGVELRYRRSYRDRPPPG